MYLEIPGIVIAITSWWMYADKSHVHVAGVLVSTGVNDTVNTVDRDVTLIALV